MNQSNPPAAAAMFALEKNTLTQKQNMMDDIAYSVKKTNRRDGELWFNTRPFSLYFTVKKIVANAIVITRNIKYFVNHANQ